MLNGGEARKKERGVGHGENLTVTSVDTKSEVVVERGRAGKSPVTEQMRHPPLSD